MIDPVLNRLPAAEHHCRGRPHAERVCGAVRVDPLLAGTFEPADPMPDGVIKNFRRQGQLWAALQ